METENKSKSILETSYEEFYSLSPSEKSKKIIYIISKFINSLTYEDFNNDLGDLQFIKTTQKGIEDTKFGRVSNFFIRVGQYKIPVFQPGSTMFISGIKRDCEFSTFNEENEQQNSPFLSSKGAIFLANFLKNLSSNFQKSCIEDKKDCGDFCQNTYKKCLIEALESFSDVDSHQLLFIIQY